MLTSKQRAKLKSIAMTTPALYQMGKNEIDENYIIQINNALDAKELIKITVLENASLTQRETAETLAERTDSEVVQVIGSKVVLYRKTRKKGNESVSKIIENLST
ncbi:RNA-binding protein [Clostridia bacterium]|nr:RNA-binding protein [Clostridia bacterium]